MQSNLISIDTVDENLLVIKPLVQFTLVTHGNLIAIFKDADEVIGWKID